jgi:hypothetical protein
VTVVSWAVAILRCDGEWCALQIQYLNEMNCNRAVVTEILAFMPQRVQLFCVPSNRSSSGVLPVAAQQRMRHK